MIEPHGVSADLRLLYLDLLKKALMDVLQSERDQYLPVGAMPNVNFKMRTGSKPAGKR